MRRKRSAGRRRNPLTTNEKIIVGVGLGSAALISLGLYEHYKAKPALPTYFGGGNLSVVLSPGASSLGLSLSGDNSVTFSLPTGASGAIVLSTSDATTVSVLGATATAVKTGTATVSCTYNDASGTSQTATYTISVGA